MASEVMRKERPMTINAGHGLGGLWLMGWLFTIGFVKLTFWKGVLGIVAWPYFLGVAVR